jgi:hypothetical protein
MVFLVIDEYESTLRSVRNLGTLSRYLKSHDKSHA